MDVLREKYFKLYQDLAMRVAQESQAKRKKVGCAIVSKSGMIAIGFNGMPSGYSNNCEWQCDDGKGYKTGDTKPLVIHAERNAIDKMTREGIPVDGSIVFTTLSPCLECAKSLAAVGVTHVFYHTRYKNTEGLEHLEFMGVKTGKWK